MAHLAWVAEQPENLANSRRALADYIALIREEGLRRSGTDEEALLRAAQRDIRKQKHIWRRSHEHQEDRDFRRCGREEEQDRHRDPHGGGQGGGHEGGGEASQVRKSWPN